MEPLNGFQANAAPSEAAGLLAACLAKRLACAGVGRAAKRCAGMGAGCGGKYHVDGVYIILSVHKAGGRQSAWSCQACKGRQEPRRRRLPDPWGGFHTSASRACTPPSRGRPPLLPVCKSYQQCTNRPPHGKGVRFRVILYWLRQRVWVVVPLAEPHSGCPARLDPSRPSDLQRRLGLTSSPAARMPMYMARGMLACLGFRV